MKAIQRHSFMIFADYCQFYLQDEEEIGAVSDGWTKEAYELMLVAAPGTLEVRTVRNTTVPVVVEVLDNAPQDSTDCWDHMVDCAIEVTSGRIVIAGCTDYFPNAARIVVTPGTYRARVCYGRLDSLSADRLKGDDHYAIALWPGTYIEPLVVKSRSGDQRK